jgi:alcohol dehydrogenase
MYTFTRLRSAINRIALPYLPFPKPFTLTGENSAIELCQIIGTGGIRRILLVTDNFLLRSGLAKPVIEALERAGLSVEVFSEVEPDPGYETVLAGVARLKSSKAEAVLALGGGSVIDCAKAVVLSHANRCHPSRLLGVWLYALPRRKGVPFYAIPTTAGTGSEATIAAVISDKARKSKAPIIDPKTAPGMVALDPLLTLGLPPAATAATGIDALTHAIEAYVSTMALPETDAWAKSAAAIIAKNLPAAYRDGANINARRGMLLASCLAGMAFTRAGVGYVHAIAHQLGGLYHVPHGLANAIVLPYVLDFSKGACAMRLADLADAVDAGDAAMTPLQRAEAFIAAIREMNAAMKIPAKVAELKRADFGTIIDRAFAEAHGTYGVPRYMSRKQAVALLERLLP